MMNEKHGTVIALGTFDGVHAGHRMLLQEAKTLAAKLGAQPMIYTFRNHPLSPFGREPKLLMTQLERLYALEASGLPVAADVFDLEFAATSPEDFIKMLSERFCMRGAVVGFNYTFGSKGKGDTELLRKMGKEMGFAVSVMEPVSHEGKPVSSSRIRCCLEKGEIPDANTMLGKRYALSGTVRMNRRIGHTLGFPTANLENYGNKVLPLSGVYATKAIFKGRRYDAVTNVGNNPTVEGCRTTVETHILNFDADIYGMPLRVEFVSRIRGEVKFSGREALAAQISADVETAKNILKNIEK